jgi:hypothetical protein
MHKMFHYIGFNGTGERYPEAENGTLGWFAPIFLVARPQRRISLPRIVCKQNRAIAQ